MCKEWTLFGCEGKSGCAWKSVYSFDSRFELLIFDRTTIELELCKFLETSSVPGAFNLIWLGKIVIRFESLTVTCLFSEEFASYFFNRLSFKLRS